MTSRPRAYPGSNVTELERTRPSGSLGMTDDEDRRQRYSFVPRLSEPEVEDDGEPQDVYALESADARELADLLAIQQDLNFVGEACDTLLDLLADDQTRNQMVE